MMNPPCFTIGQRKISVDQPAYIIAELSANHNQDFSAAVKMIEAAKSAGADAVKLQTYTADTITLDSEKEYFQVKSDLIWKGRKLHSLYHEAHTPWEWQPKLKKIADALKIDLFSSPFDPTAVDFLEKMNVPAYKIASFEVVDIPLIQHVAKTGKPIIMSTGMATLPEIEEAVNAVRLVSKAPIALLKCTSAYPSDPAEMNINTISELSRFFGVVSGLSDHTMGHTVAVASVALGARIIEKHFTLSREMKGPDSSFSMEPQEFKAMVDAIRLTESALGKVSFGPTVSEFKAIIYRRSLFVICDIKAGEAFSLKNIRSIRPGHGLAPKHLPEVLGRRARHALTKGTPLAWSDIEGIS